MKMRKIACLTPAVAGLMLLTACGQGGGDAGDEASGASGENATAALPNGMTVQEQIEARQKKLENIGGAFKTISDQLKSDSPDVAAIQTAAATVPAEATGMADWFPEGTGPDSGVETEALAIIWQEKEDFLSKISDMQNAAATLNTTAQGGDVAAIGEAFKATGGTCKACHDKFRLDD